MAQPVSVLGDVRGIARDFSMDQLPKGYVWDLVNYVPSRRGAKLDGRRAWKFITANGALAGPVTGGLHAAFTAGGTLLISGGPNLYSVDVDSGAAVNAGALFPSGVKQNGRLLHNRAWFADATAASKPKYVTRSGSTVSAPALASGANAPVGSLLAVHKDRLLVAGDPGNPTRIWFSPLESSTDPSFPGPPSTGAWDPKANIDTSLPITALWPMGNQIMVFHNGGIERIRGGIPPGTLVDSDMTMDTFTDQVGTSDPTSVVGWQENVIWAAPRGVYLSDGATMRSLTQQGGIAELWRSVYNNKRPGTPVVAAVFLDMLFISICINWDMTYPYDLRCFTLVCDLNERAWFRFANMCSLCSIPSSVGTEEVWWGFDGYNFDASYANRLSRFSDMLFTELDVVTLENLDTRAYSYSPVDQIDGNGVAMLPQIETGFLRLGPEGRKRLRHILVSHTTETATPTAGTVNKLKISYKLRPYPFAPYTTLASIPGIDDYRRYRVRLDRSGYGIGIKVEQTIATSISRLHDIAVDQWALDRGHL